MVTVPNENGRRPGAGATDQKTAGEHVTTRVSAYPHGGDPRRRRHLDNLFARRRVSRDLDELLGIIRPVTDVSGVDWYRVTGLDLGYVEREQAGASR